jgi:hypothetical protein
MIFLVVSLTDGAEGVDLPSLPLAEGVGMAAE